jgi:hypothetical protein
MAVSRRWAYRFGTIACALTLLMGCETKVSQCNQLITVVNQVSEDLGRVQTDVRTGAQRQNADQMALQLEQFASRLDQQIKTMDSISVDQPLQPFKQKLVTAYKTALTNSRALAIAVKSKNPATAQAALNSLNTAAVGEAKLLKEMQTYCQAPTP